MAKALFKAQGVCLLNVSTAGHTEEGWQVSGNRIVAPTLNPFDPHNGFDLDGELPVRAEKPQDIPAARIQVHRHRGQAAACFRLNGHTPPKEMLKKMEAQSAQRQMAFLYRKVPAELVNTKECRVFVAAKEPVPVLHLFCDTIDVGKPMFVMAAVAFVALNDFVGLKIAYAERQPAVELHMTAYTNYFETPRGFEVWKENFLPKPGTPESLAAKKYKLFDTKGMPVTI